MKRLYFIFALMMLLVGFTACSDDDKTSNVTIDFQVPSTIDGLDVKSGTLTFKNVTTGIELTYPYGEVLVTRATGSSINVPDGLYNITFEGIGSYLYTYDRIDDDGNTVAESETVETKLQGNALNVQVLGGRFELDLTVHIVTESRDFVIAEIFGAGNYYAGTTTGYNGDQYIRIHNNSSETLYADGLVILQSKFLTTTKYVYTPDIMADTMTVEVVAIIPGTGKDYPVASGKSIIICDNALDHTQDNSDSFDLSGADFEWFTDSKSAANPDADNPAVPNLDMAYNYTKSIWILNKMGNKAYAIGRLNGVNKKTYLDNYMYNYKYINAATGKEMSLPAYKFPNEWIIDAVNLSAKNAYVWGVIDSSLDLGFTYFGVNSTTAENIGKGVIRKVSSSNETTGEVFYQDTNNSSVDFVPNAIPTLATK